MSARWHKYSYSAQIEKRRTILAVILMIVSLVVAYTFVNSVFITTCLAESSTMEPTVAPGECLMFNLLYSSKPDDSGKFSLLAPPKRGDLVLIAPAYPKKTALPIRAVNAIISFLTFQRISPLGPKDSWSERPIIRRLVAFPGDTVYMDKFTLYVKPAGQTHFLTEFELSGTDYNVRTDNLPAGWNSSLPFSASFPEMTLGTGEFFVLCDNRAASNDSRIWGPVQAERIKGKAMLRYWPFGRFGRP